MVWVLFDYGRVISEPQPVGAMASMAVAAGADEAAFEAAYWLHRDAYDGAQHTLHSYWSAVAHTRPVPVDAALASALDALDVDSWLTPSAGTLAVIEDLHANGVQLALLSNAPASHARRIAEQTWMQPFAGHTFFSADLGVIKPSPEIFHHVLGALGATPGEVVFVDDRAENIAAAAALGMRTVHFTGAADLRRELHSHGVL
jgi:putative hydrolase of the HAD superfamily